MTQSDAAAPRVRFTELPEQRLALVVEAIAVIVGLGAAAWMSWTCDDAYVSYRYARHLVEGQGLVFNPGERVEGYTNLLWTLWIAFGMVLRVEPETWSSLWGLVSYAIVLVLALAFHMNARERLGATRWTLPAACLALALHPDAQVFATSGLETAAFTLTTFGGYYVLARGFVEEDTKPLVAGLLFGLGLVVRPDGTVFAAVAGLALLAWSPRRLRDAALYGAVVGAIWGATLAFRIAYYGDPVPNTYYAKSADLTWYSQGLLYLLSYLHKYWVYVACAIAFLISRRGVLFRKGGDCAERFERVHGLLSCAFIVAYTLVVVRVGGDFMYARFFVPLAPFFAILFELSLQRVAFTRPVVYVELVIAALVIVLFTPRPTTARIWFWGIANEHAYYNDDFTIVRANEAATVEEFFRGIPVTAGFTGGKAELMYVARITEAIECATGLTDRAIARQPLRARGRVGHEKFASFPYLESRNVRIIFSEAPGDTLAYRGYVPLWPLQMKQVQAYIVRWDPALMAQLAKRGARFDDFPAYLDRYLQSAGSLLPAERQEDYTRFRHFYFDHVQDPEREAAFAQLGLHR